MVLTKIKPSSIILSIICYYSGILYLWKRIVKRNYPLIVYYHDIYNELVNDLYICDPTLLVPSRLFLDQIRYLRRHYEIVSLDEAVNSKSKKVAAITFDDGYRGVYNTAFPILKNMGIPATIFLPTDYIGSSKLPWWYELRFRLEKYDSENADAKKKILSGLSPKWRSFFIEKIQIQNIINTFKDSTMKERNELIKVLSIFELNANNDRQRIFVSLEEIKEMMAGGMSFGSHTKSHPLLTWLDDNTLKEELYGSKKYLEELTGLNNIWFAYPDGIFEERELKYVKETGYKGAVQTFRHPEQSGRFSIPRIGLNVQGTVGFGGRFSSARMATKIGNLTKNHLFIFFNSAFFKKR
jgi:peptidoglycan/xylan/chitin deacetylase (PgdA/CDA1 family)